MAEYCHLLTLISFYALKSKQNPAEWQIELRFYILLDMEQVILKTYFPANLLAK